MLLEREGIQKFGLRTWMSRPLLLAFQQGRDLIGSPHRVWKMDWRWRVDQKSVSVVPVRNDEV